MKKTLIGIALVPIVIIIYLFLFGKLFAYTPYILGFTRHESPNTVVYLQNGVDYSNLLKLDTLVFPVEKFHDLEFIKKPKLFIFRDSTTYIHHSISKARFCAFPNGRLFISPWAMQEATDGDISLEIYLRHELSHVLILQHKGFLSALKYPKWLLEGIAVYSSNQMGTSFYPSKIETYNDIKQGNFISPFDFKTKKEKQISLNVKYRMTFMYSEFACIVDYLISKYGKESFLTYMNKLIEENNHENVFKQVYGQDFDKFILEFKNHAIEYEDINTQNNNWL